MAKKRLRRTDHPASTLKPDDTAQAHGRTLNPYHLGALTILETFLSEAPARGVPP